MKIEKILKITEECDWKRDEEDWCRFDGFFIETNKQIIKIGISNNQSCCEEWGYFISEDDLNKFIGSNLLSITQTNTSLQTKEIKALKYIDFGDTMFINFETSVGTLQFAAYNAHNGYYGHSAIIMSNQLNIEESL